MEIEWLVCESAEYRAFYGYRFIERSNVISFSDAGFEQWHFRLIEQIESECGEVDFVLLEKIEKNNDN
ncbi:MAG: hypothetical protein IKM88_09585 [Lachnospiraceae bacterium]|nr:hypothetical protein [Lachnospiraceae bacterium]